MKANEGFSRFISMLDDDDVVQRCERKRRRHNTTGNCRVAHEHIRQTRRKWHRIQLQVQESERRAAMVSRRLLLAYNKRYEAQGSPTTSHHRQSHERRIQLTDRQRATPRQHGLLLLGNCSQRDRLCCQIEQSLSDRTQ